MRQRVSLLWLVMLLMTLASWSLGIEEVSRPAAASMFGTLVLSIAYIKVRFIGLDFMELRDSPIALRLMFEIYAAAVMLLVIVLYLVA